MLLALLSAGCSIVPATGPQGVDVLNRSEGGEPVSVPYALVKVNRDVVRVLGKYTPRLSTAFADRTPPKAFRFGIGDIVSVTIFEAAAGGLFTSDAGVRAGNFGQWHCAGPNPSSSWKRSALSGRARRATSAQAPRWSGGHRGGGGVSALT